MVSGVPPIDMAALKGTFSALKVGVAEGLDPNTNNIVAASGLATSAAEPIVVLVRLEVDPASRTQFRLTVCSRTPAAAAAVKDIILAHTKPEGAAADSPFGL